MTRSNPEIRARIEKLRKEQDEVNKMGFVSNSSDTPNPFMLGLRIIVLEEALWLNGGETPK